MPLTTFLDGTVPAQLRGLQWLALSDLGQIGAGTVVSDTGGGGTTSWAYSGTIPCRIDPIGDRRQGRLTGGAIDETSTHTVTAPPGVTVAAGNRFAITGRGTFEVTATHVRTSAPTQVFEVIQVS